MLQNLKGVLASGSSAVAMFFFSAFAAFAALPTEATTAMTDLGADGLSMIGLVWTYGSPIVIGFVIWKLFKRGSGKI